MQARRRTPGVVEGFAAAAAVRFQSFGMYRLLYQRDAKGHHNAASASRRCAQSALPRPRHKPCRQGCPACQGAPWLLWHTLPSLPISRPTGCSSLCRLEAEFNAEVERLGGCHQARPKQLLDALRPQFPELNLQLQSCKWCAMWRGRQSRGGRLGGRRLSCLPRLPCPPPMPPAPRRHLQTLRKRALREQEWLQQPDGPVRWTGR